MYCGSPLLKQLLIFSLFFFTLSLQAAEIAMSPAERLAQQFAAMESLSGRFEQRIVDEKGELLQEASGDFSVKRPRQLYWKTTDPYQHLVVTDGKILWLYDMDLEQVTRQPFSEDLDRAPALILSGETDALAQQFVISLNEPSKQNEDDLEFSLVPKSEGGVFRKLTLRFVSGRIAAMVMVDSFQQSTQITFDKVAYNPDISSEIFQFSPPPGIDVIENER